MIFGICRTEQVTGALASLHWRRVPERILFKVVVRAVNDSAPVYLLSYFTRVADVSSRISIETPIIHLRPTNSAILQPHYCR